MRAWNNLGAFKEWKKGVKEMTFPVKEENLDEAEKCFIRAIEMDAGTFADAEKYDQGFSRAWSRLGYCYMVRFIEGFDEDLRDEAGEYTARAVSMDPLNYDVYWDRAIYFQLTGDFALAVEAFNTARELNDCNVDLIVEESELYLNMGKHDKALELLDKAGEFVHHDWFHWNYAWTCYFKARLDPDCYKEALDHIGAMHWQPGDERYMYDVQLLKAVIHARLIELKSASKSQQEPLRLDAKKYFQDACAKYRPWTKTKAWNKNDEDRWHKFAKAVDRDHWLNGVDLGLA